MCTQISILPVIEVNLDDAFLTHCDSEKLLKDLETVRNLSPHCYLSLRAPASSRLSGLGCFRMKEVCCLWKDLAEEEIQLQIYNSNLVMVSESKQFSENS